MKHAALLLACILASCHHGEHSGTDTTASPYQGQESQDIKALSPDEVAGLLDGSGLGYAKAAELNGYPGPRHVLDLEEPLDLTPEQRRRVEESFSKMQKSARTLGEKLVAAERKLDDLFASGRITEIELASLTAEIGQIDSQIRQTHLAAHIETTAVLTDDQVASYNDLRGYRSGGGHHDATEHQGHTSPGT